MFCLVSARRRRIVCRRVILLPNLGKYSTFQSRLRVLWMKGFFSHLLWGRMKVVDVSSTFSQTSILLISSSYVAVFLAVFLSGIIQEARHDIFATIGAGFALGRWMGHFSHTLKMARSLAYCWIAFELSHGQGSPKDYTINKEYLCQFLFLYTIY